MSTEPTALFQVLNLRFESQELPMSNRSKSKGFFVVSGGAAGPLWYRPQRFSPKLQRIYAVILQVAAFARGSKWMEAYNTMQELRVELRWIQELGRSICKRDEE